MIIKKDFDGKPGFEVVEENLDSLNGNPALLILFKGKMYYRIHLSQILNKILGLHVYGDGRGHGHEKNDLYSEAHLFVYMHPEDVTKCEVQEVEKKEECTGNERRKNGNRSGKSGRKERRRSN